MMIKSYTKDFQFLSNKKTNHKIYFLVAVLFIAILLSCSMQKNIINDIIIDEFTIDDTSDYIIKNAKIIDSLIVINIEYKGTKKDEFNLIFNGRYKKSYPPIVNLYLKHDNLKPGKSSKHLKTFTYKLNKVEYPNTNSTIIYLFYYDDALNYIHQ